MLRATGFGFKFSTFIQQTLFPSFPLHLIPITSSLPSLPINKVFFNTLSELKFCPVHHNPQVGRGDI